MGTEVYVNGKLRATRAVTYTALTAGGTVPVSIGNRAFTNFPYYGDLESAAVWSQALEPIDIKRLTVGRLNQTHAAAWLRFGGDYNDSNTPPASNGTPGGSASLISAPSAPDHMGNDMAARLDGTNDYVNLGLGGSNELDIDGSDGLTIFARVYPHRTATGAIVSRDGFAGYVTGYNNYRSFNLSTFGTSGPHFRVWSGGDEFMVSAVPSGFYPDWANNWHDLVSVFRPGEALEIYIDGVLLASTPLSITSINQPLDIHGNPVAINIGRAHLTGSGGWYYAGAIESVAIWGYDLTPTEIQLLSVPEPATLGLVGAGLLALARRRRRV